MKYHLYQRSITRNGKKIKAWYYWFYDENGKQVRKSCGSDGKACTNKKEAQAFIEKLPTDKEPEKKRFTYNEYCKDFYEPDSKHMIKLKNLGYDFKESTIYGKKHYLKDILEEFGNRYVDEVTGDDFTNWLCSLKYCASVRNHIASIIDEIEKELYSYHLIDHIPLIYRSKRNDTKSKGVLSVEEIKMLFPDDYQQLINTWKLKFSKETEQDTYMFATIVYTILSTGMRSCEIRALQWDQFIRPDTILINAMIDAGENRSNVLKKGNNKSKKWRIVVLPDKTVRMIQKLKEIYDYKTNYVFEYKADRFSTSYLLDHWKWVMDKNNINHDERNITIHSLRFTYNTYMRPEISGDNLRLMVGHVSAAMTDYYDKSEAVQHLPELLLNKDKINSIWN